MKVRRITTKVFAMLMLLCVVMMQNITVAKADATAVKSVMQNVDLTKAVDLTVGEEYVTTNTNNQTVEMITYESETENYDQWTETGREEITGTVYRFEVNALTSVELTVTVPESTQVRLSEGIVEYNPTVLGLTTMTYTKTYKNTDYEKADEICFWMTEDPGAVSITLTATPITGTVVEAEIAQSSDQICIYSKNDDIYRKLQLFYEKYPEYEDKVVYQMITANDNLSYAATLEKYAWDPNNNTSIVVIPDEIKNYMLKRNQFVSMADMGIEAAYDDSYDYMKEAGKYNDVLYLASCEVAPGDFVYDPAIARQVLGTDDPIKVQEMINTPDKFLAVAKKMKEAGYYMSTGVTAVFDTIYLSESNFDNINLEKAAALSTAMIENEYDTGHQMWSYEWTNDLDSSQVFGVFSTTWMDMFSLYGTKFQNGKACVGPLTYSYGGQNFIGVSNQKKNQELAALIIKELCCDEEMMEKIADEGAYIVNNKKINERYAINPPFTFQSFCGQNMFLVWHQAALAIGKEDHVLLTNYVDSGVPGDVGNTEQGNGGVDAGVSSGNAQEQGGTSATEPEPVKKNDVVEIDKASYTVTDVEDKAVTYTKTTANDSIVKIPATVTIQGQTYKVTKIAASAFKNNKKITKVTIGKNVTSIGKNAFRGCTKLKTVTIQSKVLKTIGANAFYGDKKLTKITLKTTKFGKKSVGKNALKGTNKKLVIKVPKKKVKAYKTYFKNKGNKKVTVK